MCKVSFSKILFSNYIYFKFHPFPLTGPIQENSSPAICFDIFIFLLNVFKVSIWVCSEFKFQ